MADDSELSVKINVDAGSAASSIADFESRLASLEQSFVKVNGSTEGATHAVEEHGKAHEGSSEKVAEHGNALEYATKNIDTLRGATGLASEALEQFGIETGTATRMFTFLNEAIEGIAYTAPLLVALGASVAALSAGFMLLKDGIEEAAASQSKLVSIGALLHNQAGDWQENTKAINEYSEALSKGGTFGRGEWLQGMQSMIAYGVSYNDTVRSQVAAQDLAISKGESLAEAEQQLAMAYQGRERAMVTLGLVTKQEAIDGLPYETLLGRIEGRFTGAAASALDTYIGKQKNLADNFNALAGSVGGALLPVMSDWVDMLRLVVGEAEPVTATFVAWIKDHLPQLRDGISAFGRAFGDLVSVSLPPFLNMMEFVMLKMAELGTWMVDNEPIIKGFFYDALAAGSVLALNSLTPLFSAVATGLGTTIGLIRGTATALDVLAVSEGLATAGVSLLLAGIVLEISDVIQHWGEYKAGFDVLVDGIKTGANSVGDVLRNVFTDVEQFIDHLMYDLDTRVASWAEHMPGIGAGVAANLRANAAMIAPDIMGANSSGGASAPLGGSPGTQTTDASGSFGAPDASKSVTQWDKYTNASAAQFGVNPDFVRAIMQAESGGRNNQTSPTGAQGLMQLEPGTAAGLGVKNLMDAGENIKGGTQYLADLLKEYHGNIELAAAAYNAGPGAVNKYGGVPPYKETQDYVQKIDALMGLAPGHGAEAAATRAGAAAGGGIAQASDFGTWTGPPPTDPSQHINPGTTRGSTATGPTDTYTDLDPYIQKTDAAAEAQARLVEQLKNLDASLDNDREAVKSAMSVKDESTAKDKLQADTIGELATKHDLLATRITASIAAAPGLVAANAIAIANYDSLRAAVMSYNDTLSHDATPDTIDQKNALSELKTQAAEAKTAIASTAAAVAENTRITQEDTDKQRENTKARADLGDAAAEAARKLDAATIAAQASWDAFSAKSASQMREDLATFTMTNAEKLSYYEQTLASMGAVTVANEKEEERLTGLQNSAYKAMLSEQESAYKTYVNDINTSTNTLIEDIIVKHKSMGDILKDVFADVQKHFIANIEQMIESSSTFTKMTQSGFGASGMAPGATGGMGGGLGGLFQGFLGMGLGAASGSSSAPTGTSTNPIYVIASDSTALQLGKITGNPAGIAAGSAQALLNASSSAASPAGVAAQAGGSVSTILASQAAVAAQVAASIAPQNSTGYAYSNDAANVLGGNSAPLGGSTEAVKQSLSGQISGIIAGAMQGASIGSIVSSTIFSNTGQNDSTTGGMLGGIVGAITKANPIVGAIAAIGGSLIGGLFGSHETPAQQPDVSEPTYGTSMTYGQFAANVQGTSVIAGNATYQPTSAYNTSLGGTNLSATAMSEIANALASGSGASAGEIAAATALKALTNGSTASNALNIANEKQGVITLGSGAHVSVDTFMNDMQNLITAVSSAPAGSTAAVTNASMGQFIASLNGAVATLAGTQYKPAATNDPGLGGTSMGQTVVEQMTNALASGSGASLTQIADATSLAALTNGDIASNALDVISNVNGIVKLASGVTVSAQQYYSQITKFQADAAAAQTNNPAGTKAALTNSDLGQFITSMNGAGWNIAGTLYSSSAKTDPGLGGTSTSQTIAEQISNILSPYSGSGSSPAERADAAALQALTLGDKATNALSVVSNLNGVLTLASGAVVNAQTYANQIAQFQTDTAAAQSNNPSGTLATLTNSTLGQFLASMNGSGVNVAGTIYAPSGANDIGYGGTSTSQKLVGQITNALAPGAGTSAGVAYDAAGLQALEQGNTSDNALGIISNIDGMLTLVSGAVVNAQTYYNQIAQFQADTATAQSNNPAGTTAALTNAALGQFLANMNGAVTSVNGTAYNPANANNPGLTGTASNQGAMLVTQLANALAPNAGTPPQLLAEAQQLAALERGSASASALNVASDNNGTLTLGSGAQISAQQFYNLVTQFQTNAGGGSAIPTFSVNRSYGVAESTLSAAGVTPSAGVVLGTGAVVVNVAGSVVGTNGMTQLATIISQTIAQQAQRTAPVAGRSTLYQRNGGGY